ncbi:MAG TPA: LLM class flavin-dependent oxidoreductase, partial [Solirubrobacterales bacterium]|nr:LLM class flavin-dependent oxidoreductase [Solirubrobacterales bacterium]
VSGISLARRGGRLDEMLEKVKEVWSAGEVGPTIESAPALIVGGHADESFARAARFADGWIAAGSGPEQFAVGLEKTKAAWSEAGRDGEPRTMALAYFSLGDRAEEEAHAYLTDYYAWLGDQIAEFLVAAAAKDAETVKQFVATYESAGCDELILCPSSGDPDQVDLLADAVGL